MLEPDSDESRPNVQPPQSFPILTAPLQSQPYTVGRARLMVKPRSPPLSIIAPHRSTSSQARCVPDWSDPWEARYSADSYSPRPELIPFQPPPPDELRNPPQSSDSDFPRIGLTLSAPEAEEPDPWVPRDSALSRPSREELTSPPSKRVKPSPDLNCARVERGRGKQYGFDGMVGIFGSQRAGQLPHDAGKNTSDPRDADQSYLPMIRTSNNTSATGRTR